MNEKYSFVASNLKRMAHDRQNSELKLESRCVVWSVSGTTDKWLLCGRTHIREWHRTKKGTLRMKLHARCIAGILICTDASVPVSFTNNEQHKTNEMPRNEEEMRRKWKRKEKKRYLSGYDFCVFFSFIYLRRWWCDDDAAIVWRSCELIHFEFHSVWKAFSRIAKTIATVCTPEFVNFVSEQYSSKLVNSYAPSTNAYRVPSIERNVSLSNGYTNSDQYSFYYVWNLKSICSWT